MADAKLKLQARKDSVDITKLALQGGVYAGFTTIEHIYCNYYNIVR